MIVSAACNSYQLGLGIFQSNLNCNANLHTFATRPRNLCTFISLCIHHPLDAVPQLVLTTSNPLKPAHAAPLHVQWMLVVASVKVEYPPALLVPFSALSWFFQASSSATGLDCLLGTEQGALPLSVQKVLVNLLVPVAMLATLLLLDVLTARVRRHSWQRRRRGALAFGNQHVFRRRGAVARTTIVTVFFFLPSLLRTTYGLFTCLPLDRAGLPGQSFAQLHAIGSYWMLDIDQACFEGTHLTWSLGLGIPLLLVLCILVPFGIVVYLRRCRRNDVLEEQYYITHFGFLYGSYKRSRCYWEGVIAMQVWYGWCCEQWLANACSLRRVPSRIISGSLT